MSLTREDLDIVVSPLQHYQLRWLFRFWTLTSPMHLGPRPAWAPRWLWRRLERRRCRKLDRRFATWLARHPRRSS